MTLDDYECRTCHQGMSVPDGCDPLDEDVRYCTDCMVVELERLQAIVRRLADWSKRWNASTVYPSGMMERCNRELREIENAAVEATKPV